MAPCGFVYIYILYRCSSILYTSASHSLYSIKMHAHNLHYSKIPPTTKNTHTIKQKCKRNSEITHILSHLIQVKLHLVHFNITQLILHQEACPQVILHQDSTPHPPPQQQKTPTIKQFFYFTLRSHMYFHT